MPITWVSTTNSLSSTSASTILAAAYESRATTIAKLFVPTAAFSGDTAQTVTDGSFNTSDDANFALKSATSVLATPANIANVAGSNSTAKPLIIKVRRDPFTGEVNNYGVFNADGSIPGDPTGANGYDPFDPATNPRYLVNRMTGEVYLNNDADIFGVNLDSNAGTLELTPGTTAGTTANVVGIVEFKALEGAALSTAQQQASELSNVIQSLATLIRGFKDSEKSIINAIR